MKAIALTLALFLAGCAPILVIEENAEALAWKLTHGQASTKPIEVNP